MDYDVIVIGSGIGGLTTASLLCQLYNKKVLVLEQHYRLGGFTHTFKRPPGYEWSVGVHYIGGMHPGRLQRKAFDFITENQVEWVSFPDQYDHFIYPDVRVDADKNLKKYIVNLSTAFPEEKAAIKQYFKDIKRASTFDMLSHILSDFIMRFIKKLPLFYDAQQSVRQYLDRQFKSEKLKAVLLSEWGNYGVHSKNAPLWLHAIMVAHYLDGAFYPKGETAVIADSIQKVIEKHGGQCVRNAEVTKILEKDGIVYGVEVKKQDKMLTYKADVVVSDVGYYGTKKLLGQLTKTDEELYKGAKTCVTVYLGLKEHPKKAGLDGSNFWMFESYDHYNSNPLFLSSPPGQSRYYTASATIFCDFDVFKKFVHQPRRKREQAYTDLKQKYQDDILKRVYKHFPKLKGMVDYAETSTPLSIVHYMKHYHGSIYGVPRRVGMKKITLEKQFKNLYLAGADADIMGVIGSMIGGIGAAGKIVGVSLIGMYMRMKFAVIRRRR